MPIQKEASARIKINRLLEKAGWRFFDSGRGPANIQLERGISIAPKDIEAAGDDFEKTRRGRADYLLLNEEGFPAAVLEAKREKKSPLDGKEQARRYARSLKARFVILSNGNLHYFWDLESGSPEIITEFPAQESLQRKSQFKPDGKKLSEEPVSEDYIAGCQNPRLLNDPGWSDPQAKKALAAEHGVSVLRPYQVKALQALQTRAREGGRRFLFEMATGTGKTLLSAAAARLFLRTGNAKRVLFLVDRLELERQAFSSFNSYLKNDYLSVIYKKNRDDWRRAEIVISTVQSLLAGNKFRRLFSPADFDLLISDEAHRSIGGNARALFEYFIGYKIGLTATPRDYLKNIDAMELAEKDQRRWERRLLLDTYKTFGCENSEPAFKYSLMDGVREGYLVNPVVLDARTDITAELLSKRGYSMIMENEEGEREEQIFHRKDFERSFFSEKTNMVFCGSFLDNALKDPLSGEIGKSIVFCVSQRHASKITQVLNKMADQRWPGKYNSDFAVQVTSNIEGAGQRAASFAYNKLNGRTKFLDGYKSSKTRVCVTVRMMTTGYDCRDILNLCLMRPVFSPADFVQMKGRGTRKFAFQYRGGAGRGHKAEKQSFKLFDFFAVCEFFEKEFNYDEALKLPQLKAGGGDADGLPASPMYEARIHDPDALKTLSQKEVGLEGMRLDREFWGRARGALAKDGELEAAVRRGMWEAARGLIARKHENKPELYLSLEKIRKAEGLDRPLSWKEVLQRAFGLIDHFPGREELLHEECQNFISIHKPDSHLAPEIISFISLYLSDPEFRDSINKKEYADLYTRAGFTMASLKRLTQGKTNWPKVIQEYIKSYVSLKPFAD